MGLLNEKLFSKKTKAMISLITILFISYYLVITTANIEQKKDLEIFNTSKILNTKIEIEKHNLETTIKNVLKEDDENPITVNTKVNNKIQEYISKKKNITKWYLIDKQSLKTEEINSIKLNNLSKTIILKPSNQLIIKKYIFTNSQNKNMYLEVSVENKRYISKYTFPENYYVISYVYK